MENVVNLTPSSQTQPKEGQMEKPPILKKFPGVKEKMGGKFIVIFSSLLVVLLAVATGWFFSGKNAEFSGKSQNSGSEKKIVKSENEEGVIDDPSKYQEAEGMLVDGGIKGEGTYHIERDNQPSRYVYLTSTVIGLDKFVGKKVKVWGETISAVYAPWLMDVVKIQVVE